ncbi:MAG TPA: endolytic transglycosylase MltG [Fimbriimonadaceae bacterium]|nr:endolytic transglycosylase MltG [Fimbriimonadaceae bacterium]
MPKRRRTGCWGAIVILLVGAGVAYVAGARALSPLPSGPNRLIRLDPAGSLESVLQRLEREKLVRNAWATHLYARATRKAAPVKTGTYLLHAGMDSDELLAALGKPIRQMVRMPETNWARRSANLLEKANVCTAQEYMELFAKPQEFQDVVSFPLPKKGTLEGYLYPDTYDFPPLLGARGVIVRQLQNFEKKVLEGRDPPKNLRRALIVGSMVELEVARDAERPIVAGVIENRIKLGMPLQIDASLLYGIQKWRELTFADYRNIDSPYNVYRHKGLPPGPICSPTVKSIRAALNPANHNYLYYVALPEGKHLFSATYDEHLRNIGKRKAALAQIRSAQ